MPFTPFHFGPSACIALPINRYIDVPVFVLANVVLDIEPLSVMVFNLPYPLHGITHTFLGATVLGICIGGVAHQSRGLFSSIMEKLKLPYSPSLKKYIFSGMLGTWFHIVLDSPLYTDIKPFYPFTNANPLYGTIEIGTMYKYCTLAFLPALALYFLTVFFELKRQKSL